MSSVSLVPTMMVVAPPCCTGAAAATVRGGTGTVPVASDREAKGLENGSLEANGSCETRVDISALQPASADEISASAATCGRREQSNATTRDMVTHSYA